MEFRNLDERTRQHKLSEIDHDVSNGGLYHSRRFNDAGLREWQRLLREAATNGSPASLAAAIRSGGYLVTEESRQKPNGGTTMAKVPHTAADTLAEGEFNRFYIRALCQRAIQDGIPHLLVYRAKAVANPRADSEAKIGAKVDPVKLLADLRANIGIDTALGLPNGPNSGLSVHLP